jgi:DNA-binding MarR family transcriptional regulator
MYSQRSNHEALASELNSAAIHLVRRLRRADQSLGVTAARLSALSVLVFGGPCSMSELADAEQVAGPTMSKIVAALEADGLVKRERHPEDGRAVVLSATTRGKRLMERGRRQRVAKLADELSALTANERRVLRDAAAILRTLE